MKQDSLIDELKKLSILHNSGVLSDEEFQEMKQKLLDQLTQHGNSVREIEIKHISNSNSIENRNQDDARVKNKDISKKQISKRIAGMTVGVLTLLAIVFFTYRAITHRTTRDRFIDADSLCVVSESGEAGVKASPEEITEEKILTDEKYFYEGPFQIFGLDGRAKYSYRLDDTMNTIYDGLFEFDEGFYQEDGTFNGMGSGVTHVSGQFKNGKQHGEWEIGSAHGGISVEFRDGVPNGKFRWSFGGRYGYGECKGTYKNGKLVGDFSYEANEGGEESYIKGAFDSNGKPKGIWEELREGGERRWYIMDKAAAEETGAQGMTDGNYISQMDLYLTEKIPDISEYVLSKKVMKQNRQYPTYWKD